MIHQFTKKVAIGRSVRQRCQVGNWSHVWYRVSTPTTSFNYTLKRARSSKMGKIIFFSIREQMLNKDLWLVYCSRDFRFYYKTWDLLLLEVIFLFDTHYYWTGDVYGRRTLEFPCPCHFHLFGWFYFVVDYGIILWTGQ